MHLPRFHLVLLALVFAAALTACEPEKIEPRRTNVILIVMDTAAAERCSVSGYSRPTTPELEKIAADGLNFRNTWSPSGWTGPAHASLFTGLRPEHHGYHFGNRPFLGAEARTLAEILKTGGYRTACFANNAFIAPDWGLTQGFEHYVPLFGEYAVGYPTAIHTHQLALEWVRKVKDGGAPFFLFINNMEPHFPYTPPPEFADRFAGKWAGTPEQAIVDDLTQTDLFKHNTGLAKIPLPVREALSDLYDGEIACLDHEIGKLIAEIKALGLLDETLLVITSDHGESLGRNGLLGHKFSLHRILLRVPLVIRLPGGARAGEVRDEVVRLEDVFPTILEVVGLPIPGGLDSETLLGELGRRTARGMRNSPEDHLYMMERLLGGRYGFEPFMANIRSAFDGRIHRIDYSDGRRLAFDVIADPGEEHPLED